MPYKDPKDPRRIGVQKRANRAAREKAKLRIIEARERLGGKCVLCGETDSLEFDHIDPSTKLFKISQSVDLRVSNARFWAEVVKCQLLCNPCHNSKTTAEGSRVKTGDQHHGAIQIRDLDVKYIRGLAKLGHGQREIANEFDVSQTFISHVLLRKGRWKDS